MLTCKIFYVNCIIIKFVSQAGSKPQQKQIYRLVNLDSEKYIATIDKERSFAARLITCICKA